MPAADTPAHAAAPDTDPVRALRRFNRFYTQRIGALEPYGGQGTLTLTDVRVLYELAHAPAPCPASAIAATLGLDAGYLSRILRRFDAEGWLLRTPDANDRRQQRLALTPAGHAAFAPLQQHARDAAAALLAPLDAPQRARLVAAIGTAEQLLAGAPAAPAATRLRAPEPGDIGWVVSQHGALYAAEYGWDARFEALVCGIAARFMQRFDPERERCWIAEHAGERVGCIFCCAASPTVAQLRMLLLTPAARGLGLGGQLVDACIAFARERSARSGRGRYRVMRLWTHRGLDAARALYASRGFVQTGSEVHEGFGTGELVGETWELKL